MLTFEWAGEQESQKQITFHLVTEPVTPLPTLLDELALSGEQKHEYLALGLRQVSQAAAFLNNQCKLVHGNVCWASVLVTNDLDWKLGFLDLSTEHASLDQSTLLRCEAWLTAGHHLPHSLSAHFCPYILSTARDSRLTHQFLLLCVLTHAQRSISCSQQCCVCCMLSAKCRIQCRVQNQDAGIQEQSHHTTGHRNSPKA